MMVLLKRKTNVPFNLDGNRSGTVPSCKGKCDKIGKKGSPLVNYRTGFKFCRWCDLWFTNTLLRCPCCNIKLRHKPHNRIKEKTE